MLLERVYTHQVAEGKCQNLSDATIIAVKKISSTDVEELSDNEYEKLITDIASTSNGKFFVIEEGGAWGKTIGIYILA